MTAPAPTYDVDLTKVLQRLLALGGEVGLQTQLAMHAVALEDAHARIAELEQAAAGEPPAEAGATAT